MRQDEPSEIRGSVQVLMAYLNGDESLDAALSAWRALQVEEAGDDDEGIEEDAMPILGFERDSLTPDQQVRLGLFLDALENPSPGAG